MKKFLFLLLAVIGFTACENTVQKKDLPIEVVTIKEQQKFDTVLTVVTENHVYTFDKNAEYKGAYKTTTDVDFILGFLVGALLGFGVILILLIIID